MNNHASHNHHHAEPEYVIITDRFGWPEGGGNPYTNLTERSRDVVAASFTPAPASDLGFVVWVLFMIVSGIAWVFTHGLRGLFVGALALGGLYGARKLLSYLANHSPFPLNKWNREP